MWIYFFYFLHVIYNIVFCEGAKILYLSPLAHVSHRLAVNPILIELANRGHQVTIISPYFLINHTNVEEIVIAENKMSLINPHMPKTFLKSVGTPPIISLNSFKNFIEPTCVNYLKHPRVVELLKIGKQFEVVIVNMLMNECALTTAPLLGENIIYHSPSCFAPWSLPFVSHPLSYLPFPLLPYTSKMTFFQRLNNFLTSAVIKLNFEYRILPVIQKLVSAHVPEAPSVFEVRKMRSLSFLNVDSVLTNMEFNLPNVINVGGMHCGKTKPIPSEFENFVQTAGDDGVILFSLGSFLPGSALSTETVEEILKAFGKLKQKVIWKYEKELASYPPNVKISKWLSQQDLLAHPKMRIFITHGGRLSLQEAICHGVPVIAIPLFSDQPSNVARIEELQIGRRIDFHNLTGESIYDAVNIILNDKRYSKNMKKYSAIFNEESQDSIQRGAFWVEYVIRHNGVRHFQSPEEDLSYFHFFLLDVIGLLFFIILVILLFFYFATKSLLNFFFSCKNKKNH